MLLNEVADAVIVMTAEGEVLFWNKGAEAIFDYTSAEAVGRSAYEIIVPPDGIEPVRKAMQETMAAGNSILESSYRKKGGSLVQMDSLARLVKDDHGRVAFIISNMQDSAKVKVLQDAKLLHDNFGHLLESMPDGTIMANATGHIVLANRQAEKLFGYEGMGLVGMPVEELMPARFRGGHIGHRERYNHSPQTRPIDAGVELYGLRRDGSEFPAEISLSPLKTTAGMMVVSAIRDITGRKRMEQELREKNLALQAANEELEAFSYSVSHDLRAPLRAMTGFAEILEKQLGGQLSAEALHSVERIRENAARMGQLIDALLNFASLGRKPLKKMSVSPKPRVRVLLDEMVAQAHGRQIEIHVGELPSCQADPMLLDEVFTNLLSNAVKYTQGRDPAKIVVGSKERDGETIYFVQDNGAGFDMTYVGKLFQVFQRLHTQDEFDGTGVGLAVAHRIIQRHGGRIWAEAQEGHGATFYFTLGCSKVG